MRRYGGSWLLRNQMFLPLGLTFDRYLSEDQFLQLSRDEKERALLAIAVIDPATCATARNLGKVTIGDLAEESGESSIPAMVEQRRATGWRQTSFRQSRLEGGVRVDQSSILVLQTPFAR